MSHSFGVFHSSIFSAEYDSKPKVNSVDPEERKLARRLRIEERLKAQKVNKGIQLDNEISSALENAEEKDQVSTQLLKSALILENYNIRADYDVTRFIMENFNMFNKRITSKKERQMTIVKKVEACAKREEQKFKEITSKWSDIQKSNDPLYIKKRIEDQKKSFEIILRKKNEVIDTLKQEISLISNDYNKKIMEQTKDIEFLNKSIEMHLVTIKKMFKTQFKIIVETLNIAKSKIFEDCDRKWETLFKNSEKKINEIFYFKINTREKLERQDEEDNLNFEEELRDLKIRLQTEVDKSRLQLIDIKFIAKRHRAALNYCSGVLKYRSDENVVRKANHRRKIVNLQIEHSSLNKKLKNLKENFKQKFIKCKKELVKRKNEILGIEAKANRILNISEYNFIKLWRLHTEECNDILIKIIGFDRTMHEQYMGIKCVEPDVKKLLNFIQMPSYQSASEIMANLHPESFVIDPKTKLRIKKTQRSLQLENEIKSSESLTKYKRLVKHILVVLADKSGFLTEKRLKEVITKYEDDEKTLVKLDNIFCYLQVEKEDDIDILVKYFIPYCFCHTCNLTSGRTRTASVCLSFSTSTSAVGVSFQTISAISQLGKMENMLSFVALDEALGYVNPLQSILEEVILDIVSLESNTSFPIPELEIDDKDMVLNLLDDELKSKTQQGSIAKRSKQQLQCMYSHSLVIQSVFVLEALRTFIAGFHELPQKVPTMRERLFSRKYTIIRLLDDKDIQQLWENIKNIYDQSKIDLWDQIHQGINKYYELLLDRKKMSQEVLQLRQRNKKLKECITKYKMQYTRLNPICKVYENKFLKKSHEVETLCIQKVATK